jgi:hypothetical protein
MCNEQIPERAHRTRILCNITFGRPKTVQHRAAIATRNLRMLASSMKPQGKRTPESHANHLQWA